MARRAGRPPPQFMPRMESAWAERNGQAAVTVDGKMVDYANLRMIRRLLSFKEQA